MKKLNLLLLVFLFALLLTSLKFLAWSNAQVVSDIKPSVNLLANVSPALVSLMVIGIVAILASLVIESHNHIYYK